MCNLCDPESIKCSIFYDEDEKWHYYEHTSFTWDYYNDDFSIDKIWINYCPFCGRKLINGE